MYINIFLNLPNRIMTLGLVISYYFVLIVQRSPVFFYVSSIVNSRGLSLLVGLPDQLLSIYRTGGTISAQDDPDFDSM